MFLQDGIINMFLMQRDITELDLIGSKEARDYLGVSYTAFGLLVRKYEIPHVALSCGKIFYRADIETFQEGRRNRLKHRRKKP